MTTETGTESVIADHKVVKKLGHWTDATPIEVRARRSSVVIDLRSPGLPSDIDVEVELDHSVLTILVGVDSSIAADDLRWGGKGRVHDAGVAKPNGRVRVTGTAHDSQVRIQRAGVAQLTAMLSRAYLTELRETASTGHYPTVDDPTRPRS